MIPAASKTPPSTMNTMSALIMPSRQESPLLVKKRMMPMISAMIPGRMSMNDPCGTLYRHLPKQFCDSICSSPGLRCFFGCVTFILKSRHPWKRDVMCAVLSSSKAATTADRKGKQTYDYRSSNMHNIFTK